jgi:glycine/D-amino acid oxidase-like deaminating enzyme
MAGATSAAPEVVVCGGGIIGCAAAFYLTQRGASVTLVERHGVACAASGRSGGFLALDWCDSAGSVGPLARLSFRLHAELADKLDGARCVCRWWLDDGAEHPLTFAHAHRRISTLPRCCPVLCSRYGYRRLDTLSVEAPRSSGFAPVSGKSATLLPEWVDRAVVSSVSVIGAPATTAQVTPYLLTHALLDAATATGLCRVVTGAASGLRLDAATGAVTGVVVGDSVIAAQRVVLAMGPWTADALSWLGTASLPAATLSGMRAHSVVLRPVDGGGAEVPVLRHALFLSTWQDDGTHRDPEVYPRPDGEVYLVRGALSCPPPPPPPPPAQPRCCTAMPTARWRH